MSGDHRAFEPPDPISNSEVKRCIADGSAGSPRVRVGHCQALIQEKLQYESTGAFFVLKMMNHITRYAGRVKNPPGEDLHER